MLVKMVSIIIPFYNGKKYLARVLNNLEQINKKNIEIVLVDDNSNDNSKEVIKNFEKRLNIKYFKTMEETTGVGNARNVGIENAKGKYIMFLDVDDMIEQELLDYLQTYIEQDVEMIKYKMQIVDDKITLNQNMLQKQKYKIITGQEAFNDLCFKDVFLDSPCLYLIKKELFNRTELKFEKNVYHEDFGLIPQLLVNAKTTVITEYYGYKYIQTDNSIMRNGDYLKKIKKVEDKFRLYDILLKNINRYNLTNQTKHNLFIYYTNGIIQAMSNLKKSDRKIFNKRLKKNLRNFKPRNWKQIIKKIILKFDIELYFRIKNLQP